MASLFCRFSPPSARHIEDHGHTLQKFIYYYPLGFCRFLFTLWSYIMGCNSHFLCVSITAHGLDASSSRAGLIEKKKWTVSDTSLSAVDNASNLHTMCNLLCLSQPGSSNRYLPGFQVSFQHLFVDMVDNTSASIPSPSVPRRPRPETSCPVPGQAEYESIHTVMTIIIRKPDLSATASVSMSPACPRDICWQSKNMLRSR